MFVLKVQRVCVVYFLQSSKSRNCQCLRPLLNSFRAARALDSADAGPVQQRPFRSAAAVFHPFRGFSSAPSSVRPRGLGRGERARASMYGLLLGGDYTFTLLLSFICARGGPPSRRRIAFRVTTAKRPARRVRFRGERGSTGGGRGEGGWFDRRFTARVTDRCYRGIRRIVPTLYRAPCSVRIRRHAREMSHSYRAHKCTRVVRRQYAS